VSRGKLNGSEGSVFYTGAAISLKQFLSYPHEAEWTPFQTHYFSEKLVTPEIEPRTSGSVTRISDHYTTEAVFIQYITTYLLPTFIHSQII
jgi:hypothetical protein